MTKMHAYKTELKKLCLIMLILCLFPTVSLGQPVDEEIRKKIAAVIFQHEINNYESNYFIKQPTHFVLNLYRGGIDKNYLSQFSNSPLPVIKREEVNRIDYSTYQLTETNKLINPIFLQVGKIRSVNENSIIFSGSYYAEGSGNLLEYHLTLNNGKWEIKTVLNKGELD